MVNKKVGAITLKGNLKLNTESDGIQLGAFGGIDAADYCIKEGCTNRSIYDSQYCTEHKPAKTPSSSYCKYPGCLKQLSGLLLSTQLLGIEKTKGRIFPPFLFWQT